MTVPRKTIPLRMFVFVLAAGSTSVFFINFCDLVYSCGCRSLWNGAAAACNIHTAGVAHCPWCIDGGFWGSVGYAAMVLVQGAACFWPGGASLGLRLLRALAAFPLIGAAAALATGWYTGYWS